MSAPALVFCCAPFTLTTGVILIVFSGLMSHQNWTFEVLAAKEEWDLDAKAQCCRNAGLFYITLSLSLWIWIGLKRFGTKLFGRAWYRLFRRSNGADSHADPLLGVVVDDDKHPRWQRKREAVPLLPRPTVSSFASSPLIKKRL